MASVSLGFLRGWFQVGEVRSGGVDLTPLSFFSPLYSLYSLSLCLSLSLSLSHSFSIPPQDRYHEPGPRFFSGWGKTAKLSASGSGILGVWGFGFLWPRVYLAFRLEISGCIEFIEEFTNPSDVASLMGSPRYVREREDLSYASSLTLKQNSAKLYMLNKRLECGAATPKFPTVSP